MPWRLFVGCLLVVQDASADPRAWRKGSVGDSAVSYWWRQSDTDEPEVTTTAPTFDWKVGTLSNGREFLWREGDDPEISMLPASAAGASEPEVSPDGWRIGVLASG